MKRLLNKIRRTSGRSSEGRERRLRFEAMEDRRMMSASGVAKQTTDALLSLARSDDQDGSISRSDMLGLFAEVEADGKVTKAALNDLIAICNPTSGFDIPDDVRDLAHDVVSHNPANRYGEGMKLGNLKAGDSIAKLEKLVDKWFYGDDLPAIDSYAQYEEITGSLFVDGPSYTDVRQGDVGDCYLMCSLAEVALQDLAAIENMFIDNGDGTFAVRFYDRGVARYVTVNEELPVDIEFGGAEYAGFGGGGDPIELWVALAEKAYCQMNQEGWIERNGRDSYQGINSGSPADAIAQITGNSTEFMPIKTSSPSAVLNTIVDDFQDDHAVTFVTKNKGTAASVVGDHSYAMIGYDSATQEVMLYNPWGLDNGTSFPGEITLSWSELVHSFCEWETGAA
jgi:hypothetical protein